MNLSVSVYVTFLPVFNEITIFNSSTRYFLYGILTKDLGYELKPYRVNLT